MSPASAPGQQRGSLTQPHPITPSALPTRIPRLLQTACAVGDCQCDETCLAQAQREKIRHVAFVFDDQDFSARAGVHQQQIELTCAINFLSFLHGLKESHRQEQQSFPNRHDFVIRL
jgi:hypothetical protein